MAKKRKVVIGLLGRLSLEFMGCGKKNQLPKQTQGKQPLKPQSRNLMQIRISLLTLVIQTLELGRGFMEKINFKEVSKDDSVLKNPAQQVASNEDGVTFLSKNTSGLGYFSFDTKSEAESKG